MSTPRHRRTEMDPTKRAADTPRPNASQSISGQEQPGEQESTREDSGGYQPSDRPGLSEEEIARRAYELYERRGGEQGHDMDDWLNAERDLRGSGTSRES